MLDIVISGGLAVLPSGPEQADIAIQGDMIAAIGAPGSLAGLGAGRAIDATGQIVIPGGIDPHVHCNWPMPVPDGEAKLTEPASRVSQAALFGGTTTTIDFAPVEGDLNVQQAIERRQQQWAGACYGAYAFHVMLLGKLSLEIYAQVAEAVQAGNPSVKIFTTDITPSRRGRMVQHGDIWEVLKVLARAGGIAAIHAEDNDIVMHMYEKLMREQRTGFENMAEVHNTLSEDLSFNRVIRLASNIEGAALYMMHTSAATGVRAIATARAAGVPIYGETLHQYLMYNSSDYQKPNGQIYHTYPSLKFPEDQAALWAATDHGAIQTVATDEICCPLRIKLQGRRIDDTTGGNAGVEPRVSLIYTETVEKRGFGLADGAQPQPVVHVADAGDFLGDCLRLAQRDQVVDGAVQRHFGAGDPDLDIGGVDKRIVGQPVAQILVDPRRRAHIAARAPAAVSTHRLGRWALDIPHRHGRAVLPGCRFGCRFDAEPAAG